MSPEQIREKLPPPLQGPRIMPDADYRVLRSCPFCGNYPVQVPVAVNYGYAIHCATCEFFGPWGDTVALAVTAWNVRGGK
jgi:Lar family restriction alleviation protein